MTPEQREQLEFIERCDPTFLVMHVKERTKFDAKVLEQVFDLAKAQARTLLAQTSDAAEKVTGQVKPTPSAEIDLSAGNWASVFHTAFRHAGNSPRANRIHAEIADMPDQEWLGIVDYVLIGIRRKLKDKKS